MPTHVEPTTHRTCAMTRSPSPSSLRRPSCSLVVVSDTVNNHATTRQYQETLKFRSEIGVFGAGINEGYFAQKRNCRLPLGLRPRSRLQNRRKMQRGTFEGSLAVRSIRKRPDA